MYDNEKLMSAVRFAKRAHEGEVDHAGKEYFFHPLFVMLLGWTLEERIVGVLHDVVEHLSDRDATLATIYRQYGQKVGDAIDAISRRNNETYMEYIARLSENELATAVKRHDLKHNGHGADRSAALSPSASGVLVMPIFGGRGGNFVNII